VCLEGSDGIRTCTTDCDPRDVTACPLGTKCVPIRPGEPGTKCDIAGSACGGAGDRDTCPPGMLCCCLPAYGCRNYCNPDDPMDESCEPGVACQPFASGAGPWGVCIGT
jgi:hypothetical protein